MEDDHEERGEAFNQGYGIISAATAEKVLDSLDYVRGVDAFMNTFSGASAYAIRNWGRHGW